MDTGELNADGGVPWNGQGPPPPPAFQSPSLTIHRYQGAVVILLVASCCGNQDKFWLNVPLGLSKTYQ